jgi:anion-transporting  ArsA/GET3 family ATPase
LTYINRGPLKEIHFVTGKGGVGKSTVAYCLASERAQQGKKTLLVEIGDHSFFSFLFQRAMTYQPKPLAPQLDVAHWSSQECLKSYALSLLKVEALYRLFFENPVTRSLIQVAPSLSELAIAGQITSSPRQHGPHSDHEVLVIDAFATGHFLQLIQAPLAMGETINRGPMGDQSREIFAVFKDSQLCQLHVVTTPEELPLTEALELDASVHQLFNWPTEIVMNRYVNLQLPADKIEFLDKSKMQMALRDKLKAQNKAIEELKRTGRKLRKLNFFESTRPWDKVPALEAL